MSQCTIEPSRTATSTTITTDGQRHTLRARLPRLDVLADLSGTSVTIAEIGRLRSLLDMHVHFQVHHHGSQLLQLIPLKLV